jgi:DNA-binding FadR family transcriptional regulator
MVEQFGVGRATLREALRLLESDGFLRIRMGPNGGPEVHRPATDTVTRILLVYLITSGATLRDVYTARAAIDPEAARLAATNAGEYDVERLMDSVARIRASVNEEGEFLHENATFHRILAESCGNPILTAVSLAMLDIVDGHEAGVRYGPRARHSVAGLHQAISDAICARDPEAAERAGAEHIEVALRYFESRYPSSLDQILRPSTLYGP